MEEKYVHLSDELIKRDIRPSHQRLKILEYFYLHQNHPTADEIYHELKKSMPTLSKGTIYNTLKAFMQNKLVWEISIEENEARYDLYTRRHGHFKCNTCGAIYDFVVQIDELPVKGLSNFQIEDKSVYFKGICRKCLKDIKQNQSRRRP